MGTKKKTAVKSLSSSKAQTKSKPTLAKNTKGKKQEPEVKEKKPLGFMPYLLFVIGILLILMLVMAKTGFLGEILNPVLKGLFGYGIYAVPVYLFVIGFFWKKDRAANANAGRIVLCVINFIFLLALIHLHTTQPSEREFNQTDLPFVRQFYENGVNGIGAGVIGGTIGSGLYFLVDSAITYIIGYTVCIITLMFMIGTSPLKLIKCLIHSLQKVKIEKGDYETPSETRKPEKQPEPQKKPKKKPEVVVSEYEPQSGKHKFEMPEIKVNASTFDENPEPQSAPEAPYVPETPSPAQPSPVIVTPEIPNNETDSRNDYQSIFKEADGDAPFIDEKQNDNDIVAAVTEIPAYGENTEAAAQKQEAIPEDLTPVSDTEVLSAEDAVPPYVFPPITLLSEGSSDYLKKNPHDIQLMGERLVNVLATYGVKVSLVSTSRGPAVTRYEVLPDEGVRVNRIESLQNDIRMRLAAKSVRIESNIPGKAAIGIEIPNESSSVVKLRDLIDNDLFRNNPSKLYVCLGVDVAGNPIYFDIPDMPHLIIAGATGMGKSVCINSIIISLLYRATPNDVKFIFIDPKKIELSCYNGIPHLLVPVVNEPRTAAGSLNWAVNEMERRYTLMNDVGNARTLDEYNDMIEGDPEREKLPNIVIIIDELADLMLSAKDAVETSICRLAQKARAAGIYLILGTQRPDATVITGLIKANVPSKIAFTVSQAIDSRIILDESGAEQLLGKGDMLFAPVKSMKKIRVQGAFVDGKSEVAAVCSFVKNASQASYSEDVMQMIEQEAAACAKSSKGHSGPSSSADDPEDPLFLDALGIAFEFDTMATSLLQRKLSIGYSRAQKIIDMMEDRGYVGKFDPATKKRKIIITQDEYNELRLNKGSNEE